MHHWTTFAQYSFRGSEAGYCPRYIHIKHLNLDLEPWPAQILSVFQSGTNQEAHALELTTDYLQLPLSSPQRELTWHVAEDIEVVGHVDSLLEVTDDHRLLANPGTYLVEVKSMSRTRYTRLNTVPVLSFEQPVLDQMACYCLPLRPRIAGFILVGRLWNQDEVTIRTCVGNEFDRWLSTQEKLLSDKLKSIAAADRQGIILPIPAEVRQWNCSSCRARFHCYSELLD